MSEPREKSPPPAERRGKDDAAGRPADDGVESRPDYKEQDEEGGMPNPEYDIYRDLPGERVGG